MFTKLQSEMNSFVEEDKQSEILVQWFETKLKFLSDEMREHANSHNNYQETGRWKSSLL